MSRFHLLRQFRRVYGVTPRGYLSRIRLDQARRLLSRGTSVTDACLSVGFSSVGSFSSSFRRQNGCSPSEFRRATVGAAASSAIPWCMLWHAGLAGPGAPERP